MTGHELLAFLAALWELPRGSARARIGEVVDRFGLAAVLDRRIATYSGGTRRRLDLAGALLHKPRVLFLDEPSVRPPLRRSRPPRLTGSGHDDEDHRPTVTHGTAAGG